MSCGHLRNAIKQMSFGLYALCTRNCFVSSIYPRSVPLNSLPVALFSRIHLFWLSVGKPPGAFIFCSLTLDLSELCFFSTPADIHNAPLTLQFSKVIFNYASMSFVIRDEMLAQPPVRPGPETSERVCCLAVCLRGNWKVYSRLKVSVLMRSSRVRRTVLLPKNQACAVDASASGS